MVYGIQISIKIRKLTSRNVIVSGYTDSEAERSDNLQRLQKQLQKIFLCTQDPKAN